MNRTTVLQEIRKMYLEETWNERKKERLTQEVVRSKTRYENGNPTCSEKRLGEGEMQTKRLSTHISGITLLIYQLLTELYCAFR